MTEPTPISTASRWRKYDVRSAQDIDLSKQGLCLGIYANPGVGKTTLAADLNECEYAAPVHFIEAEGGKRIYAGLPNVTYTDVLALPAGQRWGRLMEFKQDIVAAAPSEIPWRTIVVDNVCEIQSINLRHILGNDTDPVYPQHWGTSTLDMLSFIRALRDVSMMKGVNVIFNVWEKYQEKKQDDPNSRSIRRMALSPSLATAFAGVLEIIGYMTVVGGGRRQLTFSASPTHQAKFRRNRDDIMLAIPETLTFGLNEKPLVDILRTLKGGVPFPVAKYRGSAPTNASVKTTNETKENA